MDLALKTWKLDEKKGDALRVFHGVSVWCLNVSCRKHRDHREYSINALTALNANEMDLNANEMDLNANVQWPFRSHLAVSPFSKKGGLDFFIPVNS